VRKRLLLAAVSAVVGAAYLVSGVSASRSAGSLTLYSGQHEQTVSALVAAFEKQTGINVSVRSDSEGVLASQIVQEGSHARADVFYTENSPPLEALAKRGLLTRVKASTLAKTPARYQTPARNWTPVSARVSLMVYNTDQLKPSQLPKSILELAQPKWKGKLGLAPTETDFQPIVTAVAAKYGKARAIKWLEGIKNNASGHIYPDNEALVAQINSGQAALGFMNNYYWYRLRDELGGQSKMHSAIHYFTARDPGYVVNVSGAGILDSSSHQAEAQKFLAFLDSPTAQGIIAHDESFEYPLGSGVKTARGLAPFSTLQPDPITVKQLGDGTLPIELLRQASLL
jgi:iron(III) transport system substrate-binding protein